MFVRLAEKVECRTGCWLRRCSSFIFIQMATDMLPQAAPVSLTTFAAAPFCLPPPISRTCPWPQVESLREESRRRELELSAAIRDQQSRSASTACRGLSPKGASANRRRVKARECLVVFGEYGGVARWGSFRHVLSPHFLIFGNSYCSPKSKMQAQPFLSSSLRWSAHVPPPPMPGRCLILILRWGVNSAEMAVPASLL